MLHLNTLNPEAGLEPEGLTPGDDLAGDVGGEQGWGGPSEEEWSQTQQALGAIAQFVEQQQAQQNGSGPQIDPFNDRFQEQLDQYFEQKMQPFQQYQEYARNQEANELAMDMIASAEANEGEFLMRETDKDLPVASPQMARAIAEDLLPQFEERFGQGSSRAVEAALTQAVKYVRAYEDRIGQAYEQRKQNELQARLSAPFTAAANGQAAQGFGPGVNNETELVAKYTGFNR